MTWSEIKRAVEEAGVREDEEIGLSVKTEMEITPFTRCG
jgi:hypothetical protein